MEKEMIGFIRDNNLSLFSSNNIRASNSSIFKTADARAVHTKILAKISSNFVFSDTKNLFQFFPFTQSFSEIKERQDFFKTIQQSDNSFLKLLKTPKQTWKPKYGVIVVTEDEKTFLELQKFNCPVQFLNSMHDLAELESYDLVQVIDCDNFSIALENLTQTIFLDSMDEVYLERYLETLSAWRSNLEILQNNKTNSKISEIISELFPLLNLLKTSQAEILTKEKAEHALEKINDNISDKIKQLTVSGDSLFSMLSRNALPKELQEVVESEISLSGLPDQIFNATIPVTIDEKELSKILKQQSSNEFIGLSETVRKNAQKLKQIPQKLQDLQENLILFDFTSGISQFTNITFTFPESSEELSLFNSENPLLEKAQPISFYLNQENKCSILTGANSGGKTTLIEHLLQSISLFQLGLPISGSFKSPMFSEVYYFAKNKGSMSKGAFETLLTQMSKIQPGKKTLILADEIESVTEPGVAGKIICATAEYFIKQDCFLVIATHLGQEIQKYLPQHARIDGIEAKGLDENYELIVDHNPVLGRLANSTPELIVARLANSQDEEYFKYINEYLKGR